MYSSIILGLMWLGASYFFVAIIKFYPAVIMAVYVLLDNLDEHFFVIWGYFLFYDKDFAWLHFS